MAHVQKRGSSWYASIRKVGQKSVGRSFPTKTLAAEWVRQTEKEMDEQKYQDVRPMTSVSLSTLIDRYNEEIGGKKGFGRSKTQVLGFLKTTLGHHKLSDLTTELLCKHVSDRIDGGTGGVTINIELTYLKGVFKVASDLWNIRCDLNSIKSAKASLGYKGISTQSTERKRRPTQPEIDRLVEHFNGRTKMTTPMADLLQFAIASAMRSGEITRITWGDLNEQDRTIIIRDRKHPTKKLGNDKVVPLLGDAYTIVQRQPRPPEGIEGSKARIFPYLSDTISCLFPRACQNLGIEDLHFHDLRHEGVSRLFEKGYDIPQVSLVSGHEDWQMLKRYVQLSAKDLHRD